MADLTVAVNFTRNTGQPATGLTLGDIDLYLTEQDKATGADTVIWNGTQNPTEEIDNTGFYTRIYAAADWDANHYYARGNYTGAVALDTDDVMGAMECCGIPIGTAVEFTYTIYESGGPPNIPIAGVTVAISTDIAGVNIVWSGTTDAFGVARNGGYLPRLDPGTYYFWRSLAGYTFTNPDTEVVV
jgi:hypothetical protein